MKKSSPIMFNNEEQTLTEAGLFIHPITYDDYGRQPDNDVQPHLDEPVVEENIDVNNNFESEQVAVAAPIATQTSIEDVEIIVSFDDIAIPDEDIIASEDKPLENEEETEIDAEMQRKIEEMIESVMSAAREEVDWLKASREDLESSPQVVESFSYEELHSSPPVVETCIKIEKHPRDPPLPPPRRKSNIEETVTVRTFENIESAPERLPIIDESDIVPTAQKVVKSIPQTEVEAQMKEVVEQIKDIDAQIEQVDAQMEEDLLQEDITESELVHDDGLDIEQRHDDISFSSQLPSRLHLSSLEIDNLNVCSLSAGRITSSEIDTNTIVTNELDVKVSHNLANPMSMEFPPGFIEEIVERVRSAERAEQQTATLAELLAHADDKPPTAETEQAPARPPLPSQFGYSAVPPSFFQLRDFSEEEAVHPQMPQRRRRHQNKRKDSTSEEEYQRDQRTRNRGAPSGDQSILGLGGQFARACGNALRESGGHLMEVLRASSKDENKRDLHIALIILIVIVAGLILMSMGDKSVHHHHWDFFNPPDNHGR